LEKVIVSSFNSAYTGTPAWDIGRPQKEFVHLARANEIQGRVLDVGCGTGEHALYLAASGLEAWGVDSAPAAIDKAVAKAKERGLRAGSSEFPRPGCHPAKKPGADVRHGH
jgi:2-polyprenyl-3-methyl-5-hydroxy-6-metoxy-1,4-benzoquinol methylase